MPSPSTSTALQDGNRSIAQGRSTHFGVDAVTHTDEPRPTGSGPQAGQMRRKRASAACLQCRRVKSRCKRDDNPELPCERCRELGTECEMVKSRRGRVLGSRNRKRHDLEKTLAHVQAALDRIRRDVDLPEGSQVQRKRVRLASRDSGESDGSGSGGEPPDEWVGMGNVSAVSPTKACRQNEGPGPEHYVSEPSMPYGEFELDGEGGEIAELPLESTRHSPDPDNRGDHDHPLSLLSNVGHTVPSRTQESDIQGFEVTDDRAAVLLPGWSRTQLHRAASRRQLYFRHLPGAAKRDVVPVLDPISRQFLTVEQGEHLVKQFFAHLQPQIGFMDPTIHTLANLRLRSALLLTAVLATGAQTQDMAGAKRLAQVLYKHAEDLLVLIIYRNAKSPEIVLALLILSLWPRCPERIVDDQSRILLAIAINMALELGMHRERPLSNTDEIGHKWQRDRMRTWISCVIQDKSLSAVSGTPSMVQGDLDLRVMNRWLAQPLSTPGDRMLVGFLELRLIERDVRERLDGVPRYMVESVRANAGELLDGWIRTWITPELILQAPSTARMMHILAHHVHLLITTASETRPDNIIPTARSSLEFVLSEYGKDARYICRTVCGMISWAAVLLLRLNKDESVNLVRDVGLTLAPFGDGRFEMSYAHLYGSFLLGLCINSDHLLPPSGPHFRGPLSPTGMAPLDDSSITVDHLFAPGGELWPGDLAVPSAVPHPVSLSDLSATELLNPLLSADQLGPPLGLDNSGSFDFDLPWDIQQSTANSDGNIVSPPMEWLFNDSATASVTTGARELNTQPLWGFGLGWSNTDSMWQGQGGSSHGE